MCGGPQWKREIVPDHKFDFIDTRDFADYGCWMRTRYLWLYVLVLKSFLVYVFDIFTAITMLTTDNWSNQILHSCNQGSEGCVVIPFKVGKWLFVGCIIFSFVLLAYEARKSKKIIASRDISYAFTNIMANNYYSLRSYDHFCFFCRINNSTKKTDDFAFFIFFTFKSWKRLLLADGPRQVINALTLYSFYISKQNDGPFYKISKYTGGSIVTAGLIFSVLFTVLIFAGSALLLLAAGICYIPLLCYIRGNLKEYCCHKVDKRIAEIVKRKKKERIAKAAAQAKKEAKGEVVGSLPQPTLPNISLDDDFDDNSSMRSRGPPPSNYTGKTDYYNGYAYNNYAAAAPGYPPPMPAYQDYGYNNGYRGYEQSAEGHQPYYEDVYGSQVDLTAAAAPPPMARQSGNTFTEPLQNPHSYVNSMIPNPRQTYNSNLSNNSNQQAYASYDKPPSPSGLAYDDPQDYAVPPPHQGQGYNSYSTSTTTLPSYNGYR